MNLKIDIPAFDPALIPQIQHKLDNKAKPVGSLGRLESLALQVALIQNTLTPELKNPVMLTVAADHGITAEGVSACPVEITWQQVHNFLEGGGGIGLLAGIYGLDLWVVDAGVNYQFKPHPKLIDAKVAYGSESFLKRPAMSLENCVKAIENGRRIVRRFHDAGTNVIGFGEMGIGNTTPASALLSIFSGFPVDECVGPGAGLNSDGVRHKAQVITAAIEKHGIAESPIENLARFGGYEIATIAGGMLGGAGMEEPVAGDGGGSGAGSGGKSAAERAKDRKAARASIKSSAAEPVDIDADAAVPAAPNLYGGRAATAVTITFTVQLRDPVGREIAPAGPAGEEGAAQ